MGSCSTERGDAAGAGLRDDPVGTSMGPHSYKCGSHTVDLRAASLDLALMGLHPNMAEGNEGRAATTNSIVKEHLGIMPPTVHSFKWGQKTSSAKRRR